MVLVRSLLFQIYFALMSAAVNIIWLPSLLGPPRWALAGIEVWGRLTLWGLRVICGLSYEVRGREHLEAAPALYAGKHLAMWDTVALPLVLKHPALVLKRQLLSIPFYGWYARKAGMIAIDRDGHAHALRRMVADGKARLAEGRPIAIFPEGTRKKPGAPADYKPGAAALYSLLDVACVPFALNSGVYWTGALRKPGRIVIEFLPAIAPGLKRRDFMAELERRVEAATARMVAEAGER